MKADALHGGMTQGARTRTLADFKDGYVNVLVATDIAARGHEAVAVSHQLPIWILRSYVERWRLRHDPRKRQCTLASLTSFTCEGDRIVAVGYSEPARDLVPAHLLAGAKPKPGDSQGFGA